MFDYVFDLDNNLYIKINKKNVQNRKIDENHRTTVYGLPFLQEDIVSGHMHQCKSFQVF